MTLTYQQEQFLHTATGRAAILDLSARQNRAYSDGDRDRWIAIVRRALEQNHIGWTMWDYQGGFGVVTKKDGNTVEDQGVLQALGLK